MLFLDVEVQSPVKSIKRFMESESSDESSAKKIKLLQNIQILPPVQSKPLSPVSPPLFSPVETQTESSLTASTPRKRKLKTKLGDLQQQNRLLKKELETALAKLNKPSEEDFKSNLDKYLNPSMANFVKCQLDLVKKSEHGKRYTNELKQFALSLYFLSPKCYKHLQKTFCLPSYRSLCRFIEKVTFTPGVNDMLFKLLKLKVEKLQPQDKICVLCFDEISLKTNLFYNYGTDTVIGLEDNGKGCTDKPASSATVLMVRGMRSAWKQPIAYTFSSTSYDANQMKDFLENIIQSLNNIGLEVMCLISDMGSNCLELSKILGVTLENPKINLAGRDIFYLFDPPHMIKALRNNLLHFNFKWDNQVASWSDIVTFYEKDSKLNNRLAPKLTKSHINPTNFERMRVKLATQVISNSVVCGLETYVNLGALPESASGTIHLLSTFDKLFDIFNSSNLKSTKLFNKPFRGDDHQIKFLNDTLQFLNKINVHNTSKNKNVSVKFIKCWQISINSLLQLWQTLKSRGFKFLFTRRLNQDCLENYFGFIRQQHGNCVNPTPIQFTRAFKKSFVMNFIHTDDMNCIEDFDSVITELSDLSSASIASQLISSDIPNDSLHIDSTDYQKLSLPEQNAFQYICGYLVNKCQKIHSCLLCEKFSTENGKLDQSHLFIHFKNFRHDKSMFGSLKTPHESFYHFVYKLEQLFLENINSCLLKNPAMTLYRIFQSVPYNEHPCPSFPVQYLLKLFIRLRIYYLLKNNNSAFRTTTRKNRKISILMNL